MSKAGGHEQGVEGLRGFAALAVLYTHFLNGTDLDPGYYLWPRWLMLEVSQGAVLLFFILSGYVIGLTNTHALTPARWGGYLHRRALRLIPLCWLAVFLSVLARPVDDAGTVVTNLLFLQNNTPYGGWHAPVMQANTNLWTLNYEALYYLLFGFVWWRPGWWPLWLATALLGSVAAWMLPGTGAPLISCYALGWVFWLAGYGLARTAPKPSETAPSPLPWPSILLFWLVTWQLKPLWGICHRFGLLPPDSTAWANYAFVDFLPSCVVLMLAASGRRPRWTLPLCYAAAAIPLSFLLWTALRGRLEFTLLNHLLVFSLVAVGLWKWRPDAVAAWSRLAWVGGISYGIYILQRPVQWFIRDASWLPRGNAATFTLRLVLAMALTFAVAWWAEKKLQPLVRRLLGPRPAKS